MNIDGRDIRGRFIRGHRALPRRSRPVSASAYLEVVFDVCTIDEWTAIVAKAVEMAKSGDGMAREWLTKVLHIDAPAVFRDDPSRSPSAHAAPVSAQLVEPGIRELIVYQR
jgi:hypothetical protein